MSLTDPIHILRVGVASLCVLAMAAACEQSPIEPGAIDRTGDVELEASEAVSPIFAVGPASHDGTFRAPEGALALAGGKFVVDDDGADCPKADFTSIQAAVDAAAANPGKDKIEICAGTYPEDVSVGAGNPLELRGDGIGATVITGAPGSGAPIIHIVNAGDVKIDRLTVDGQFNRNGGTVYGIRSEDTDTNVKEIRVANIMNAARSNQGIALGLLGFGGASDKGKVEKSTFEEFSRVGILAHGDLEADIKHNDVLGPGETTNWAPNGIQVSGGATAKVEHNVVRDADHVCQCASGIILFQAADGVDVKHNDVSTSDIGIIPLETDAARISHNDVQVSDSDGVRAAESHGSEISHNKVWMAGDDGIQVGNGSTGITTKQNRVADSTDDGYVATGSTSGNLFEHNRATGSGDLSCNDTSVGGGTAGTANTWKKNEGESPSDPPEIC